MLYNPPSCKSTRGISFGYEKRSVFKPITSGPDKVCYTTPSDFDCKPNKGRIATLKTKGHDSKLPRPDSPGPAAYDVRGIIGKNAPRVSLGPRIFAPGIILSYGS